MIEYITTGLFLLVFEIAYIIIAKRYGIIDCPHHQSSHTGVVIRGGGIIFYVAFLLWSSTHGLIGYGGLVGLTILAGVSFVDDIHSLSPKFRLICQFVAILMMFYHSGLIQKPPHVIVFLSIACVGSVNIFNFMDGVNGMTGGYSLVVALSMLYVELFRFHFVNSCLIIYVIIAIIIFNVFNFRKHAICFAGDVGSMSIGFILMYFVLRLALYGHSMSWIAMLSVYGVDGGMTILHRIILRENLMKPHKKHAYQIMANELKIPHLVVTGIYMGLQALCSAWYIIFPGYMTFFMETGILVCVYLLFMKKYFRMHVENH